MTSDTIRPNKKELVDMLNEMNLNIEKMPSYALSSPISHYDFSALIILLHAIFNTGE